MSDARACTTRALPRVFPYVYASARGARALLAWNIAGIDDVLACAARRTPRVNGWKEVRTFCRLHLRHVWIDFRAAVDDGTITARYAPIAPQTTVPPAITPAARRPPSPPPMAAIACVVCLERPRTMASVACGHVCVCAECGDRLGACPICRRPSAWLPLWWA